MQPTVGGMSSYANSRRGADGRACLYRGGWGARHVVWQNSIVYTQRLHRWGYKGLPGMRIFNATSKHNGAGVSKQSDHVALLRSWEHHGRDEFRWFQDDTLQNTSDARGSGTRALAKPAHTMVRPMRTPWVSQWVYCVSAQT